MIKNTKEIPITIVTPNFNGATYLEETIDSVLSQGYHALEYLIIDGGSTDESVEIIKKFEKHLSYWVSESDQGQSHAINKGLKRGKAEWQAFLNSDDCLLPGALHQVHQCIQAVPHAEWIVGGTELRSKETLFSMRYAEYSPDSSLCDWVTYKATAPQPSSFWKKSLLEQTGYFSTSYHYCFDTLQWLKFSLFGAFPHSLPEPLARFRVHTNSKSGLSHLPFLEEHLRMLEDFSTHFSTAEIREAKKLLRFKKSNALVYEANHSSSPLHQLFTALTLNFGLLKKRHFWGALKKQLL